MFYIVDMLLFINVVMYESGKFVLAYKLFKGYLRFPWQYPANSLYRGEFDGYLQSVLIIIFWPFVTKTITSSYVQKI